MDTPDLTRKRGQPKQPLSSYLHEGLPPLNSGDRLTQAEFERRYRARPDISKAELIEGVVYVASPVSFQHGLFHLLVSTWFGAYWAQTPGILAADNATLRLDSDNEVQPDLCAWRGRESGRRVRETRDGYLAGAPDLVVEVAISSAAYDLHDKLTVYRRNGVQEYLVLAALEQKTTWYQWQEGSYHPLAANEQGILRSQVFPGLWLSPEMFWQRDMAGLLAVVQQGLATPEHAAFAAQWQSP